MVVAVGVPSSSNASVTTACVDRGGVLIGRQLIALVERSGLVEWIERAGC